MKSKEFGSVLGPLESDVLKLLWSNKKLRVREIYNKLKDKRKVALTSIAVILDRLYEKSLVNRAIETTRGGIRYIYSAKKDKKQFERSVVEKTINHLIKKFGDTALTYFNERFSKKR